MLPVFGPGVATQLNRIGMNTVRECRNLCKMTPLCTAFAFDENPPSNACILINALVQGTMGATAGVNTYMLGCTNADHISLFNIG